MPLLRLAAKRALDVVLSALVLALMSAVIGLVALAIAVESPGPVLYRAERVGREGRGFRMLKFRKMHAYSRGLRLTTLDDARFTRVGAFLARSKLDELPQFVNVLRGEMSLIGPRPEDPGFVAQRRADYDVILRVRPGITGLSQLAFAEESRILSREDPLGDYLERIFPQKCALDRLYVRSLSVRTDVRILLWTVVAVLFRRDVAVNRFDRADGPAAALTASTTRSCCACGHMREQRQRHRALGVRLRERQVAVSTGVDREAMDGRIVNAGLHAALGERRAERIARRAFVKDDREDVVRGGRAGTRRRAAGHDRVEPLAVRGVELTPPLVLGVEPLEAPEAYRSPRLVEPVVVAERHHVVTRRVAAVPVPRERRHAVRAEQADARGELVVSGGDHPALADGQVLV